MKNQTIKVPPAPGKYNRTEEAILAYLYAHPEEIGAKALANALKSQGHESWQEFEEGIKTLIADGLAKGKRVRAGEDVWHEKLQLTSKGEAEAIKQERRQGLTVNIEFIDGDDTVKD